MSSIISSEQNYTTILGNIYKTTPKSDQHLLLNVELAKHIGVLEALIHSAFVEFVQKNDDVCKQNKWWFPYSYTEIGKRTRLTKRQVRRTLNNLEGAGVIEVSYIEAQIAQTAPRCYRLIPIIICNGQLLRNTEYFNNLGMPKTNYVPIIPTQYQEYVPSAQRTPRRRSIPGAVAKPCA